MATEPSSSQSPRQICEALLQADRTNKIEQVILPSEVDVIDRLLARGLELDAAYEELCRKLYHRPPALRVFFDLLQSTAAFWSPQANLEARKGRAQLIDVNRRIEEVATELASLLNHRTELKNHSGFSCDTLYHPVDAMHAAGGKHYSYQQWVKGSLDSLTAQFDLKYWPSLSEVAQAVADDAARAVPLPHDEITHAGTEGRAGLADSFKAFFAAIADAAARNYGFLPNDFQLTDRSVASLMSCALDLGPEEIVDAGFVKRLRQRERTRARQAS